ncbi:MAG: RIP metalloprotease RseP, partial [Bacteroidetes bacterium]|nr:RIP metalloprotease RseP [Bacteroidota bacterium]
MDLISTIFYFLVTIGILVLVHELGHFLAAKLTGMRIDRFSIGFPPRAFGKQIGETDYCISWIPIGGYVKIAGMIDESMDTEFVGKAPEAWEFRSKSFLAKLFVMIAGVVMNILLAVLIFWGINYSQGKFLKETTEIGYVIEQSVAQKIGLFSGDKVQEINNQTVLHWGDINSKIYIENIGKDINIKILRDGKEVSTGVSQIEMQKLKDQPFGIYPAGSAALVSQTESGKPAEAIGMKPGDIILSIGNE